MPDATIPVRERDQLDWPSLEQHLRLVLELPVAPMQVRQFPGGHANLTYLLEFDGRTFVLRRPPHGSLAPGSHDMAREHRVLSRLGVVYPRAPWSLHFTDDASIIGAPFVVVEHRRGEIARDDIPPAMAHHEDIARRVDLALIDAAADLHVVDVEAAGLGDLGHPDGFGQRQITGWRDRWRHAAPEASNDVMDEVAERLVATVPEPVRVSVVHNDLKLDNCQFAVDDPDTVTSVFDWDMATVGDPLFDLGSMLVSMASNKAWVLTNDEAVQRYAERSGMDVTALGWYLAFATFRTAVVLQQLYNRYESGDSTDERLASYGAHIDAYAERARELLRG